MRRWLPCFPKNAFGCPKKRPREKHSYWGDLPLVTLESILNWVASDAVARNGGAGFFGHVEFPTNSDMGLAFNLLRSGSRLGPRFDGVNRCGTK